MVSFFCLQILGGFEILIFKVLTLGCFRQDLSKNTSRHQCTLHQQLGVMLAEKKWSVASSNHTINSPPLQLAPYRLLCAVAASIHAH